MLTQTTANRARLRDRIATLLGGSFEEVWIETWAGARRAAPARLRARGRDRSLLRGRRPGRPARADARPPRRAAAAPARDPRQPGRPARRPARADRRAQGRGDRPGRASRPRPRRRARRRPAAPSARSALRELEFADLFDRHDAIMLELGMLDEHELVLELGRVLTRHPGPRRRARRPLRVAARRRARGRRAGRRSPVCRCSPRTSNVRRRPATPTRGCARPAASARRPRSPSCAAFPAAERFELGPSRRSTGALATATAATAAAPACPTPTGQRARRRRGRRRAGRRRRRRSGSGAARTSAREAQAVAREIEHLLASGESGPRTSASSPAPSGRESRLIAAALEERNVPFRSTGSAAFFGRPEVRDAIAWLRALADPSDSAAVVRALTRPPVELRSVDLARCTTIARRRKLDMISAVEAALESPQLPPPSRDRLRAFLKLYRAAAKALRRAPRRRLRAPPDRAGRLPPPRPVRGQPRDRRAARQPLAARRARGRLDPPPARRLDPRLRPLPGRGRRGRAAVQPPRRAAAAGRRPARRARAGQGDGLRPRLPARPRARGAAAGAPSGPTGSRSSCSTATGRPAEDVADALRARRAYLAADPGPHVDRPLPPGGGARNGDGAPSPLYEAVREALGGERGDRTRRSCSGRPRASTRPTGCSATRSSRRRGGPAPRSARCASTPPRTSTAPSPATSSCSSSRR